MNSTSKQTDSRSLELSSSKFSDSQRKWRFAAIMKKDICHLMTRFLSFQGMMPLLCAFVIALLPERSHAFYPFTVPNHIMPKQIYRRLEAQDWMTCLQECHSDIDCSSYNFKYNSEVGNECELSKCAIGKGTTWEGNYLLFKQGFVFQQIRPSKNENVCATAKEDDKVPPMSFGGLEQSSILQRFKYQHSLVLSKYLDDGVDTPRQWKRCYHAFRGNIAPKKFHYGCNSKGPTVTIIRDSDYIFGGYFDHSWKSSYFNDCSWQKSTSAFLFSLYNKNLLEPHRFNIKQNGFSTAVYDCLNYGPTFGHGHDLVVYGNNTEMESYSRSASYETPPGCNDAKMCSFYTGNFYFSVDEIEVFYEYK